MHMRLLIYYNVEGKILTLVLTIFGMSVYSQENTDEPDGAAAGADT